MHPKRTAIIAPLTAECGCVSDFTNGRTMYELTKMLYYQQEEHHIQREETVIVMFLVALRTFVMQAVVSSDILESFHIHGS
jgi:hypothetical protein